MQKKQKNQSRGLSLPPGMWKQIEEEAECQRRSINNFLTLLIEKALENTSKR